MYTNYLFYQLIPYLKNINNISFNKNMNFFCETNSESDEQIDDNFCPFLEMKSWEFPQINMETIITSRKRKNNIFNITKEKKEKKVGRKRVRELKNGEKSHTKYDQDNIIRKVQVDFYKFLVSFINDILKNLGIPEKFLKIKYNNIKNVKKQNVENFKLQKIGDILRKNISTKYKKQYKNNKDKNNRLFLEVTKNDIIKNILSETSINIFRNYYYKNKRDLKEYNIDIKLSNNIKTFENLLEKNNKDSLYTGKIKEMVAKFYLPQALFTLD